jgi:glycosyltransferase involved in cell wall biosynthesis
VRIGIVTSGRFHVLDLARELEGLGYAVAFYSLLPLSRAQKFGLPKRCHRSLLLYLFPFVVAWRICPRLLSGVMGRILQRAVDFLVSIKLERCDVFIGMSGLCVRSAVVARKKYGAKIFIERGSRHILSQKRILEQIAGSRHPAVSKFDVERELWDYEFADVISVPSKHVERSFQERGIAKSKLFRNPYGVDLSLFVPTEVPSGPPTAIFVGEWSLRKGCDVLWEVCLAAKSWRLLHVGLVGDAPLPEHPLFTHSDPVSQMRLPEFYRRAHIFVHASREEGLSLVQDQALACGLPLVCTDRTGGEDLKEILGLDEWVTVVPAGNVVALAEGIAAALARAKNQTGLRDILGDAREKLSWRAYGKRYHDELLERCSR